MYADVNTGPRQDLSTIVLRRFHRLSGATKVQVIVRNYYTINKSYITGTFAADDIIQETALSIDKQQWYKREWLCTQRHC